MRFELFSVLSAFVLCAQGQTTLVPNYFCNQNSDSVEFTLSPLSHSAWEPTSNCSLEQCLLNSHNSSCRSSTTPCFDYRTPNNTRYCAPGILCSILEPCNSTAYTCTSVDLVCAINSCCSPQAVCIPTSWAGFCVLASTTTVPTSVITTTTTSSSSTTTSTSSSSTSSTASTDATTMTAVTVATTALNCFGPRPASLGTVSGNTNTSWVSHTYNYTATKTSPLLTFGFDATNSMYIALDDVSVIDIVYPSIQLLNNPGFENSTTIPTHWTTWCSSSCNTGSPGAVVNSGCRAGRCYLSQCSGGGVDYLGQAFSATIGHTYTISFWSQRVKFASTSNNAVNLYTAIM